MTTATNITGRRDIAEDCAMMAIMAVWERQGEIKDLDRAGAFMFVATRNLSLNEARDAKARYMKMHKIHNEGFCETDIEFKSACDAALKEVSQKYASRNYVNVLKAHIHGYDNKGICELLHMPYQSVRNIKNVLFSFLKGNSII